MKNLIFCAFAFKEGFETSFQTNKKAGTKVTRMYLQNIFVALTSAKLYNPNDDVLLATNCDLSDEWQEQFATAGILTRKIPFDRFEIPREFPWALAYYKLCALQALTEDAKYDHILLMDADTYTTRAYEELWAEADFGVLLFPVGHSYAHPDREVIRKDFVRFYPAEAKSCALVHYGGEFVAGKREELQKYLALCEQVYLKMKEMDFRMENHAGDETVWSVAAALAKLSGVCRIVEAGAYIYRFWTGDFYLVSTVTVSNPVCIWHIPNEKETGFLRMYAYYGKHGEFPTVKKAAAMFGISKAKRPFNRYTLGNKVNGKLSLLLKK